ncbi:MAG: DUF2277 domain-containing protein [Thermoleophilia bacterium]
MRKGRIMCRNIKALYNYEPPVTDEEVRKAALQYVRKISGFARPSAANEEAYERAVSEIAQASSKLLDSLVTASLPRNRAEEEAKAHARAIRRFS